MRRILSLIAILLLCAGAMCCALSLGSVAPPHFKSAHAQLTMTGAGLGAPGGGGPSFSLTYESNAVGPAGTTTVSYGTVSYGSSCTRVILAIAAYTGAPNTALSATINGVSATELPGANAQTNYTNSAFADLWQSNSAVSGSSGTISVTYSIAPTFPSAIATYCLITTTPTVNNVQIGDTVTGGTVTTAGSLTVPSGGGGIAAVTNDNGNAFISWTGVTPDASSGASAGPLYVGHVTASGALTASFTPPTNGGLSAAAWSP